MRETGSVTSACAVAHIIGCLSGFSAASGRCAGHTMPSRPRKLTLARCQRYNVPSQNRGVRGLTQQYSHTPGRCQYKSVPGRVFPREFAVALAIKQIGKDRNDHRQGANNHRRNRRASTLNGTGKAEVIDEVAHHSEHQGGKPVAKRQLTQTHASQPGNG